MTNNLYLGSPFGPHAPVIRLTFAPGATSPAERHERAVRLDRGYHLTLHNPSLVDAQLVVEHAFAGVAFTAAVLGMDTTVAEYVLRTLAFDVDRDGRGWHVLPNGDLEGQLDVKQHAPNGPELHVLDAIGIGRDGERANLILPASRLYRAVSLVP